LEPFRRHPDAPEHRGLLVAAALDVEAQTGRENRRRRRHGHVWDGDLREYNNPLPKWWLWLFYITIVFGVLYLVLYPGPRQFRRPRAGRRQTSTRPSGRPSKRAPQELLAPLAALPIADLMNNEQAMSTAHNLFQQNCAQCHGSDGGGAGGLPQPARRRLAMGQRRRLRRRDDRRTGRVAAMPPWAEVLGDQGVDEVVLRAAAERPAGRRALATAGQARFETLCAACHGMDGKGNPLLGAPNLTDDVWLYGSDAATLKQTM
jgi:cytochrome c oxidase cbb3-type subunit III